MKSYLVAKLYPDSDAKSKEKLTFPPHRTNSKTQPTRKRNFEKTFTFTRQFFIFSPPHTVTGLFSSDRPLFGSDGAVKVMALTALKTSVDTQVLIGRCFPLLLHYHRHEIPSFSLTCQRVKYIKKRLLTDIKT